MSRHAPQHVRIAALQAHERTAPSLLHCYALLQSSTKRNAPPAAGADMRVFLPSARRSANNSEAPSWD